METRREPKGEEGNGGGSDASRAAEQGAGCCLPPLPFRPPRYRPGAGLGPPLGAERGGVGSASRPGPARHGTEGADGACGARVSGAAGLRVEGCHAALPSILLGGFLQNPPFPTVSPLAAVAGPSSQLLPGGSVGQSLAELRVCAVALQSPLLLHRFYEWLSKALTVLS